MAMTRRRIAVVLLAALAATVLLHLHVAAEPGAVHCNVCIQQTHVVVADAVAIDEDVDSLPAEPLRTFVLFEPAVSDRAAPRAPPA